jgi:hypothetical protein
VVTIQPSALAGTPSEGQRATAIANASWTAPDVSRRAGDRGDRPSPVLAERLLDQCCITGRTSIEP